MDHTPSFVEFLQSCPPGEEWIICDLIQLNKLTQIGVDEICIECTSDACGGLRTFECVRHFEPPLVADSDNYSFSRFMCRNCRRSFKTFAVRFKIQDDSSFGPILKLAEDPPFGPRIPSRVVSLIGPDKDLFFKGRRSENQSLGIGAFAYYRRVIENQKNRLLEEIIRAAKRVGANPKQIELLEAAVKENQFSKAIDSVKNAMPPELMIKGYNPLTLLHTALSEGLHAMSDTQCLELATSIREYSLSWQRGSARCLPNRTALMLRLLGWHRRNEMSRPSRISVGQSPKPAMDGAQLVDIADCQRPGKMP
jgi:hypothetical protein